MLVAIASATSSITWLRRPRGGMRDSSDKNDGNSTGEPCAADSGAPHRIWYARAMTRRRALICAAGGAALGALFTITPLTICVVALGAIVVPALLADLPGRQRRLATAIVGVAIVARLVAIGGV